MGLYNKTVMNIFYCDDDSDDIEFFQKAIANINSAIDLTAITDAEEALSVLASKNELPHFIFLDLHMPKMDGLECVIAIKRNKRLKRIPIAILANGLSKTQIEQFNKLGVFQFISKTTYEDLELSLRNILDVGTS